MPPAALADRTQPDKVKPITASAPAPATIMRRRFMDPPR
jgi:hypothetical protein